MPIRRTGADEITRIERVPEWKQRIDEFAETHPIDFEYDPEKGFMAPSLVCTLISVRWLIRRIKILISPWVTISVTNSGNGISFSSYVEVYARRFGYNSAKYFRLSNYRVLTINPGQTVNVRMELDYEISSLWLDKHKKIKEEKIVGVCYDPILDPLGFRVKELNDRQLSELVKHNDHIIST